MEEKQEAKIVRDNPKVDRKVVAEYDRLAAKLRKAGIDISARYSISPPLGGAVPSLDRLRKS